MKGFDIMFSYEIKKELACEMIDYIENYGIQDMYLCDIASNLYNNDYYIIGIYLTMTIGLEHFLPLSSNLSFASRFISINLHL